MFRTALFGAPLLLFSCILAEAQGTGARVKVNGMQMYYEVSGAGEPLVVLHGAYMNIPTMGAIIPQLAKTHKVYALELQGHGRTTDIDRPITYQNLADDVAAFMDAVGLPKADVFGYSMGAGAGLQFAIRHPAKLNKLVAASVALGSGADHRRRRRRATLEHTVALFKLLGGGVMGDMGKPLPASRLAVLPATSHTAVITQADLLQALIKPFLKGQVPKSMFEK